MFKEQFEAVGFWNGLNENINTRPLVAEPQIGVMDGFVSDAVAPSLSDLVISIKILIDILNL